MVVSCIDFLLMLVFFFYHIHEGFYSLFLVSLLPLPPIVGRGSALLLLQGGPLLPLVVEKSLGYYTALISFSWPIVACRCKSDVHALALSPDLWQAL